MRLLVVGFSLSLALSNGQLIVLPTNLEYVRENDLRSIYDTIRRLEYDFVVLKEQIVAAGKEGLQRGLVNFQQNIDRIAAAILNGNVPAVTSSTTPSISRITPLSERRNTQQRIPPVVIKNTVPTRYSFRSGR